MRCCLLRNDRRGMTATEFGLLAPVFMVFLMGSFDMTHRLYMNVVLQGAVQKAARDSALERSSVTAAQAAIDAYIRDSALILHNQAQVTVTRTAYRTFTDANRRHEPFTDTNGDGTCNGGEPYDDLIENGYWDATMGVAGQGGAQDVVVFSATVRYPNITPISTMIGLDPMVNLKATTVIRNQPYNDQGSDNDGTPEAGVCA